MTPDEARALLDGTTPGPWEWVSGKDDNIEYEALRGPDGANALRTQDAEEYASWIHGTNADKALAAAAPALARTIAGMREEWGASYRLDRESGKRTTWGWETRKEAERAMRQVNGAYIYGIVRRYVTNEEEA